MLVNDIRKTVPNDLVFGVANSGSLYEVMRFDHATKGNIRVGPNSFNASQAGAGATLSVAGIIASGDNTAANGSVMLCSRYGGPLPQTLNVLGSHNSTGNSVLSYGVRPRTGTDGYSSTNSLSLSRSSIEVGTGTGSDVDNPVFRFLGYLGSHATPGKTTTAVGTAVPLTPLFNISGLTATFAGLVQSSVGFSGPHFGSLTGNAQTASTLQTSRTITLSGDVSGSVVFNGSSDAAITTTIGAGTIVNADIADGTITDAKLQTISTGGKVSNSATTATTINNANTIVVRGTNGEFNSGLITCALTPSSGDHLTRKSYVDSHPMLPKVFAVFTNMTAATPTVTTQRTITNQTITIARTATGTYNINFPAGLFSDGNYVPVLTGQSGNNPICRINTKTNTTLNVSVVTGSLGAHDPTSLSLIIFGA
jgi:hypothetical protein